MHGGDTTLANKLRRLLAYLAIGLVVSVFAEFAISIIESGRAWWSGGGIETTIFKIAAVLLWVACVLLVIGSLGMLGLRTWARRTLLGGSAIWLTDVVGLISGQASSALRATQPRPVTSWLFVIRQAENWVVMGGALPLLLFAFTGWPELIPKPTKPTGQSWGRDSGTPHSSLATRLMRVISVFGIVFGGTRLAILLYLVAINGRSLPDLRFPRSFSDAFQQFSTVLDWTSASLLVLGAFGELLGRTWGRRLMLLGAVAWIADALCSLMWGVLIIGRSMTAELPLYALMLLGRVERSAYPVMLLVCLRWPEVRTATTSESPAGFQPIMPLAPGTDEAPR